MKIVVIGLGSMGKRRVRCLKRLGILDIIGYDVRQDRRDEAEKLYQIVTIQDGVTEAVRGADAVIISTPPDKHLEYIEQSLSCRKPCFVEASVTLDGLEEANKAARDQKLLVLPSCTMRFHPSIRCIKRIIDSKTFGKVVNFSYHSGQYLPDWHPWEHVKDFYVSNRGTGAAREIVPFELTWLVDIVGFPLDVVGFYGKTMDLGADIDDTYALALKFESCLGVMIVDAVSRYATRSLTLNMELGQIDWSWDSPLVRLFDGRTKTWLEFAQEMGEAHKDYNKNIVEEMYVEELSSFLDAVKGITTYPNSLEDDIRILNVLHRFEQSVNTAK